MRLAVHKLLSLFLAAMLVAGQWAGQLHALSHAKHELAVAVASAGLGDAPGGGRHAPARLDHSADLCVAFHALDGASVAAAEIPLGHATPQFFHAESPCTLRAAAAPPFLSRAPPILS